MADGLQSPRNMTRLVLGIVVLSVVLFSIGGNAQSARTATPALALESLTGRDSFDRYCAACHGADGLGAGPVASALKTRPADLTTLAERNGGSFPRARIAAFVEGTGRPLPSHGTGDMPGSPDRQTQAGERNRRYLQVRARFAIESANPRRTQLG